MKDKFVIFAEEPPVELQLSVEMRCREIEKNPDVDYLRKYCISLIRNNAKRDAMFAATLKELAEAHVTIAEQEKAQVVHWWVLKRMINDFFISIVLFFVVRLNKALLAVNNKINKKI